MAIFVALLFLTTTMLLLSSTSSTLYLNPNCQMPQTNVHGNRTIHLVHGPQAWLPQELRFLERLILSHPNYRIHLTIIEDGTSRADTFIYDAYGDDQLEDYKTSMHLMQTRRQKRHLSPVMQPPSRSGLEAMIHTNPIFRSLLLRNATSSFNKSTPKVSHAQTVAAKNISGKGVTIQTSTPKPTVNRTIQRPIGDLLKNHSNVAMQNVTYQYYFSNTYLEHAWHYFSDELKIFAVRVLELWQYGGISFSFDVSQPVKKSSRNAIHKIVLFENGLNHSNHMKSAERNKTDISTEKTTTIDGTTLQQIVEGDNVIAETLRLFEKNSEHAVILDVHGDVLAVKAPCHVFLEEVLTTMRRWKKAKVESILKSVIALFCKSRMIADSICRAALL